VTWIPLLNLTLAILRNPELGFFGVIVLTCKHTPRFWGADFSRIVVLLRNALKVYLSAGAFVLLLSLLRPLRTN
jgi:hypothetical protein